LEEEALNRTVRRIRFGKDLGTVYILTTNFDALIIIYS